MTTYKIQNFINHISTVANKNHWVARYDKESDEFSLTRPKLSKNARIHYVNDELALYFSKDKIEGVFIEYFKKNFIAHQDKSLQALIKTLKVPADKGELLEMTWTKVMKIAPELEKAIQETVLFTHLQKSREQIIAGKGKKLDSLKSLR